MSALDSDAPVARPRGLLLARLWAVALLVLGILPITNWIPGGHDAPWYRVSLNEWLYGTLVAVGVTAIIAILSRRLPSGLSDVTERLAARAGRGHRTATIALTMLAFCLYAAIARWVFSAKPLLIDEIVQVMQARIFAAGRLVRTAFSAPEFFSALNVVDFNGRTFSQFPPGGPLMLTPGVLLGVAWLTGPVFGALSVAVYWQIVRNAESRQTVSLGAAILFAFAPFMVFMAGSHMNHVPTLFWLCLAMWALQRLVQGSGPSPHLAALCGLSFGVMATIRPVDALAFALPAGVWLLTRAGRERDGWRDLAVAGAGVAVPLLMLLAFNADTTGKPFLFGYELLWGKSHALGFHRAPWGVSHTPERGLELVNLYFLRLQNYLFETPVPSLVPCAIALALTPALRAFDRYLLWGCALLVTSYFAYWHDGFFLGPRFFYLLLPALVLWTARLPSLLRTRLARFPSAGRIVLIGYAANAGVALMVSVPVRVKQYAGGLTSMRQDFGNAASVSGVHDALILIRESWGAQVIARLWALGVPRSDAERIYWGVDTCELEQAVSNLERSGMRGELAVDALRPLLRDSIRLVRSDLSPDSTERVLPGSNYGAVCAQRITEDRAGYTFLAPTLAMDPGTNVYARDLHQRDTLLFHEFPGRPVYLLRPRTGALGAPLDLMPVSLDSARADWHLASEY
jgi:hypothetical protein